MNAGVNFGGGRGEVQSYTKENISVNNGTLTIKAHKIDSNHNIAWWCQGHCNYNSGKINSLEKVNVRYGKIEARIKMALGNAIRPSFWMISEYGVWPKYGEIDIVDMKGRLDSVAMSSVYWGDTVTSSDSSIHINNSLADDFYIYSLIWNKDSIITQVNGHTLQTFEIDETSSFAFGEKGDQNFYMTLEISLGGGFDDAVPNSMYNDGDFLAHTWPDDDFVSTEMFVDWVRISKKTIRSILCKSIAVMRISHHSPITLWSFPRTQTIFKVTILEKLCSHRGSTK